MLTKFWNALFWTAMAVLALGGGIFAEVAVKLYAANGGH